MKILIVKTVPGEIIVKKVTYNHQEIGLARALIESGHQCDVVCIADNKPSVQTISVDKEHSITLYCMKALKILKNGFYLNARELFKKYDILHVSEYNQLFTWHMAEKYKNKIVCYHGPYYSEFNKRYNLMAKVFDLIFLGRYKKLNTQFITKSELAADYLRRKGLSNVKAIGVGIDRKALTSRTDDKLDFVDIVQASSEEKIMYIGKMEPRRNVFFLLTLLKKLRESKDVILILVGSGDSNYIYSFFQRAEKENLSKYIIYRERIEQKYMEQLYSCADIFVLPTIYDIYGMVLLEAMYFGQCVFTTINGGSNMMIQDGENGFVFNNFEVEDWSRKIIAILNSPEDKKRIAMKAHSTIEEKFTWEKLVPQFTCAYKHKIEGER